MDQSLNFKIEPNSTAWSPKIWLKVVLGMGIIKVGGELRVDVECVLDCVVGEFFVKGVRYNQENVELGVGI